MRIRLWSPSFSAAALALLCLGSGSLHAGSWFGPSCYGADYAYEYPNRAHNYFGCGPGTNCTARHPLFRHHWLRKNQATPADGAAVNTAPFQYAPMTPAPQTVISAPIQAASVQSAPAFSRMEPIAQPLPAGSPIPATPTANSSAKPPF